MDLIEEANKVPIEESPETKRSLFHSANIEGNGC